MTLSTGILTVAYSRITYHTQKDTDKLTSHALDTIPLRKMIWFVKNPNLSHTCVCEVISLLEARPGEGVPGINLGKINEFPGAHLLTTPQGALYPNAPPEIYKMCYYE